MFSSDRFSTTHKKENSFYDLAIVGGGIVGLATARELISRYPEMKLILLEKEFSLGKPMLDAMCKCNYSVQCPTILLIKG